VFYDVLNVCYGPLSSLHFWNTAWQLGNTHSIYRALIVPEIQSRSVETVPQYNAVPVPQYNAVLETSQQRQRREINVKKYFLKSVDHNLPRVTNLRKLIHFKLEKQQHWTKTASGRIADPIPKNSNQIWPLTDYFWYGPLFFPVVNCEFVSEKASKN